MPEPVGSPLWWVERLEKQLRDRQPELKRYDDYYEGRHNLAFSTQKFREAFGGLFEEFADNWCELVVDAVEERLNVEGFRFGEDPEGDGDAWGIWQRNQLDAESQLAHTEALIKKLAYAFVWTGDDDETPKVHIEDPTQAIVEHQPGSRRERAAALKLWKDEWDGRDMATLYLPEGVYKYRSAFKNEWTRTTSNNRWVRREVNGEPWPLPNPLGKVPVVPLVNRPRLLKPGQSEIAKVIPLQDGVNKLTTDMFVSSEFAAFKQRWATGLEIPVDPVTKQPIEPHNAAVQRTWINENPEGRYGEFDATDLTNYVKAIEMVVQHIASQTRTPPHYFYLRGEFPSGEALALNTPVPTPEGWKTMGSLRAGDLVYDEAGTPTRVRHAFPVLHDRPCYRVVFDDGSSVVADAGHRWLTSHSPRLVSRAGSVTSVVTTEEIARTLHLPVGKKRQQAHHWLAQPAAVDNPVLSLPIDPYVLGCWLGDGSRGHGHMTCHADDAWHFADEWEAGGEQLHVYSPSPERPHIRRVHADRMRGRLAALGVLHEKRIPRIYFEGAAKQRLALLQGLMDTDGSVNRAQGSVVFSSKWQALAEDALELIRSLGHKAALSGGSDKHGWRIAWSALDPVFRLERKAVRQRTDWNGGGSARRVTGRYIVAVEPVESVPVRCIEVESSSHLFLVGDYIPTHNSIKSAETGLVAKTRRKMRFFGEGWEEVMRLCFGVLEDPRANVMDAETIWADPESRTEAEHVDAVMKKKTLEVPLQQLWEDLGYSPTQIKRFKQMRAEMALLGVGSDLDAFLSAPSGNGSVPELVRGVAEGVG